MFVSLSCYPMIVFSCSLRVCMFVCECVFVYRVCVCACVLVSVSVVLCSCCAVDPGPAFLFLPGGCVIRVRALAGVILLCLCSLGLGLTSDWCFCFYRRIVAQTSDPAYTVPIGVYIHIVFFCRCPKHRPGTKSLSVNIRRAHIFLGARNTTQE